MIERPTVIDFPGTKKRRSRTLSPDGELFRDILRAQKKLCRAIEAAFEAGLEVELIIDASARAHGRVRQNEPRVTRTYK